MKIKKLLIGFSLTICAIVNGQTISEPKKIIHEDTICKIAKRSDFNEIWDFSGINFSIYPNTKDSDLVQLKDPNLIYNAQSFETLGDSAIGKLDNRIFKEGAISVFRTGVYHAIFNGNGTLKIPGKVYSNVDKIKITEIYKLSINKDTIVTYKNIYYVFFGKSNKQLLLTVFSKSRLLKGGNNIGATYNGIGYSEINGSSKNNSLFTAENLQMKINPNPASGQTSLNYNLVTNANVVIEINNQSSSINNLVFSGNRPAGQNQRNIPLNQYQAGLYTVKLTVNGNVFSSPLIIQ